MEAIVFPNGAQFAVTTVEVLHRRTSHYVRPGFGQADQPTSLYVRRDEFELCLVMPAAEVPLHCAGALTMGNWVLSTTLRELWSEEEGVVALASGVHDDFSLPTTGEGE